MNVWRRHLNERVRLHLVDGPTVEGRLMSASGRRLKLIDAHLVLTADRTEVLEGAIVVGEDSVRFGQALGVLAHSSSAVEG